MGTINWREKMFTQVLINSNDFVIIFTSQKGRTQMFNNGEFLRKRYDKFLGKTFVPDVSSNKFK